METSVFDAIRREIADEYAQPHEKPWIVGFSGGKDSTLVAHLVVEHLLSVPRSERVRPVHVVANDTLVESPLVIGHLIEVLEPPVGSDSREAVLDAARAAWDALWHPPPAGCADDYLHDALTGATRAGTIERLSEVERHTAAEAANHIERYRASVATAEAKKRERVEIEQLAPEVEAQTEQLKASCRNSPGRYEEQRDTAQRELDAAEAELGEKRAELGRYMSSLGRRAPDLDNAARADAYARADRRSPRGGRAPRGR